MNNTLNHWNGIYSKEIDKSLMKKLAISPSHHIVYPFTCTFSIILTPISQWIGQSCPIPFQYFNAFNKYIHI